MRDVDLYLMPLFFLGVPAVLGWVYAVRQTLRAWKRSSQIDESSRWQRARAPLLLGLVVILGVVALAIGPPWFRASVTPAQIRGTVIRLLTVTEIVYCVVALITTVSIVPLVVAFLSRRKRNRDRLWLGRYLVLTFSILLASAGAEFAAVACLWANSVRMPWLPLRFADPAGDQVIDILVIGESSAAGVPYEQWLSVGDIVAWKLGEALPQRSFRLVNQAAPGLSLQSMHAKLAGITRRPELVILYAGHNEFQSRFDWAHAAYQYADETPPIAQTLESLAGRVSPLIRLIQETSRTLKVSTPPPGVVTRRLVDVPVYSPEQYAERLTEFNTRLGAIVNYCEWIGAQVVLVIPPSNEVGFEPNRSFLPRGTLRAEREAFASEFSAARRDEMSNPGAAEKVYRRLLACQPCFAESHFRLARLLENAGHWDEAFRHYAAARDFDGLPLRLPSDFFQAYRDVAGRHPKAILVDGPAEFRAHAKHGLADDEFFTDGLHPTLNGYTVLAQAILTKLREQRVFGWSADDPYPVVTPKECAQRFQMDSAKWSQVCTFSARFYRQTAFLRYDPAERNAKSAIYAEAAQQLNEGNPVDSLGIPGVGPWQHVPEILAK